MYDVEHYLKSEYRDPDFRLYELKTERPRSLLRLLWTLCLSLANSLY